MNEIIQGDCLDVMKTYPDNHFSSIVTDPPYGLKFMGKDWDHGIPGIPFWQEALRISKAGSYMLAFGGTRTFHRLTCAIEDAGWEVRDCIMWLYGSGFPKGKGCLKPAWEPIIMARKKGPNPKLNIDECRIGSEDGEGSIITGRWPANLILDDEVGKMLDEQSGILKSGYLKQILTHKKNKIYGEFQRTHCNEFPTSSGGASRFFYCAKASRNERNMGCEELPIRALAGSNKWIDIDYRIKSNGERVQRTGSNNNHPTVKPIKLMEYLIKLVTPKEGILLDPFAGSGTTILAAKNLGYEAVGIEMQSEYVEIAKRRTA